VFVGSAGLRWVLLMLQHQDHSRTMATDEKKKSLLCFGCDFSVWSVHFPENHYNCCHQISYFKAKMHQIRLWLGLCPRPAREAYSAPQTL